MEIRSGILSTAQRLAETYDVAPRDALHIASCIENGIDEIITDDADFDRVKKIKRISLENTMHL